MHVPMFHINILTLNVLNANELKNERMSIQIKYVSNGKAQLLSRIAILTETRSGIIINHF